PRGDRPLESGALRGRHEDADAGDPRRARLPGAGEPQSRVLRRAEGEGGARAPRLFPRREPLGAQAQELAALVSRGAGLARALARRLIPWSIRGPRRVSAWRVRRRNRRGFAPRSWVRR